MEVNIALDITREELFDSIGASLEYDIKESTGKNVKVKNIKPGYSYKKKLKSKLGQQASVEVFIEEFTYPEAYVARFESGSGTNRIKYLAEDIEDDQIGLTYIEEYEGMKTSLNLNMKFFDWILSIPNKKAIKNRFREMEKEIIRRRELSDEEKEMESLEYYDED